MRKTYVAGILFALISLGLAQGPIGPISGGGVSNAQLQNGLATKAPNGATQNIYVDGPLGNDTTGARGTMTPVKTLTKAFTLAQAGDSIVMRKATYTDTGLNLNVPVNIIGNGATIQRPIGSPKMVLSFGSGAAGTTITNLTVDGNIQGGENVFIDQGAILLTDCPNVTIKDVTVKNSQYYGLRFIGACNNLMVDHCLFDNVSSGIVLTTNLAVPQIVTLAFPMHTNIKDTTIQNTWNGDGIYYGLNAVTMSLDHRITNCRLINIQASNIGIELWSGGQNPGHQDVVVEGCHFAGSYWAGVSLDGCQRFEVSHGSFKNMTYAGVEVPTNTTDGSIHHNYMAVANPGGDAGYGIIASNQQGSNHRYDHNSIIGGKYGIRTNAANPIIDHNTIVGFTNTGIWTYNATNSIVDTNTIIASGGGAVDGIFALADAGNTYSAARIQDNQIRGAYSNAAIQFTPSGGGTFTGALVTANNATGSTSVQPGIWVTAGTGVNTRNNTNLPDLAPTNFALPGQMGTGAIVAGTGDGANYTTFNTEIDLWNGLGFRYTFTNAVTAVFDVRNGTWDTLGGYKINGAHFPRVADMGSGSDGSGSHALFDDGTWKALPGGGSVSTVSVGNLSPIFTASVANATTTPAATFTLSNAAAHSYLGNNTGSSAAPDYHVIAFSELSGTAATAQVANSAITYGKIQDEAATTILGNPNGAPAAPIEVSLDSGMSFSSGKLRAFGPTFALPALAMDASAHKSFSKTLATGTNTFTWSNLSDGDTIMLRAKQVPSGSPGTIVFPTAGADGAHTTFWKGGSQPVQTATVNKSDRYICSDDGGDMYCFADQNY